MDLNLLVILDVLLEERQVTKAAERLHMSQPAVSRALQRLRRLFSDPLLVRNQDGYDLTVRAAHIQSDLRTVLQGVQNIVTEPEFNPAMSRQEVKIAGPDLESALYIPELMSEMHTLAPGMSIDLDSRPNDYFEMLANGDIHFAISGIPMESGESQFHRVLLETTETAILMGQHHPLAGKKMSLDDYLNSRHGYISITGKGLAMADVKLKEIGKQRQTVLRLTSFMAVIDFCEKTDLIFMLPLNLIEKLAQGRRVVCQEPPELLRTPALNFYLYWHERHHHDPMHQWVRRLIIQQRERRSVG